MENKKDCWDWISNKFEKTEARLKKKTNIIYLTFYVFKSGEVTYSLGTSNAYQDYPVSFTAKEIISSCQKAYENGLIIMQEDCQKDNPISVIKFIKPPSHYSPVVATSGNLKYIALLDSNGDTKDYIFI